MPDLPLDLLPLGNALISACQSSPLSAITDLLDRGAPTWYQDPQLGWSCLHYAAERREPEMLRALLRGGAIWNAVDHWGRTAGEICVSLGDEEGWEIIRNEGVRSGQSCLHATKQPSYFTAGSRVSNADLPSQRCCIMLFLHRPMANHPAS